MKLNELKRLNNILYRYTGLGKIEKDVDNSFIYHSCYYLDKVLQGICDDIENSGGIDLERPLKVRVKILEEDITEDDKIIHRCAGLEELLVLAYHVYLFDGCSSSINLFDSGKKIEDSFEFIVEPALVDTIEENIFNYYDEERKTFKGFGVDSYELDFQTKIKVVNIQPGGEDWRF